MMFFSKSLGMMLAELSFERLSVLLRLCQRLFHSFDNPLCFAQQSLGIDRSGNHVEYSAVLSTEIGSYISSLLLLSDDAKRTDLLKGRDEMLVEILADFGIRQCVHTERFGVISRKV